MSALRFARAMYARPGLTGGHHHEELAHEPSLWLRGRIVDVQTRAQSGQSRLCRHLGPHSREQPLVALWAVHRIECPACFASQGPLTEDEDFTCDRCRRKTPAKITVCTIVVGRLLVNFGLCRDCHTKEAAR